MTIQHPGIPGRSILAEDSPGFVLHRTYVESYDPTLTTFGRQTQEPQQLMRVWNDAGRALVVGEPLALTYDGDEEELYKVIVPAAIALPEEQWPAIAVYAAADQTWTWVCIGGAVDALVDGTTDVTKDDYLKFAAAGTAHLIKDGTTRTLDSVGIATLTYTTAAAILQKIILFSDAKIDID